MADRDIVALSIAPALRVQRWLCAADRLHRPEPTEPPGPNPNHPDEPGDPDDLPPDPDRLPGEPIPPPIGDPPPNHAPQSARASRVPPRHAH
jgi:hypothetical protein